MGDLSNEPSMEDILSSIKRIIAEEGDGTAPARGRRIGRPAPPPPEPVYDASLEDDDDTVLELDHPVPSPRIEAPAPRASAPEPALDEKAPVIDAILSARTAEATRGQIDALSRLIVKPGVAGNDSLEGLVREMLKPMMSAWLDANLPRIVETIVAREIARITGRND
ncbi:DUF2497 domain-containing protein [Sphingomonas qomolangmaensis]|uniref:DUF2497 domain-containing protein n=1 Tax=Sphingomonas qomolangmaensis TaxID=2918765 RepID=A0ABY5LD06_9SPHN|nr:DUF2497 domain-containing protein [Sphingomonas qomolangmaensis]UUL83747.1 DUF2497 domain-containing protein [Sphingomonas qomolangmaensis]